jgi:predicted dehydrogenase
MIRIAVIGAGHWGPNLIRLFDNRATSEVAWVVDRDPARLKQVSDRHDGIRTSADLQEPLQDLSVDAVVVATPTTTHYRIAKAALLAGKHVLIEKPLTTRVTEGEELCSLAGSSALVLMVGHVYLYHNAVEWVHDYLQRGELGRIFYMSMTRTNLGPIRRDVNAAWDLAAHDISIANFWAESNPISVAALGGTWINKGTEDVVFATLGYPDDMVVNIHASWLNPRKSRDITVVGEKRMLTFDDMSPTEPVRVYDKRVDDEVATPSFIEDFVTFRGSVREGEIWIPRIAPGESLKVECDHFLECIQTGARPRTDGRMGLEVVKALAAVDRSLADSGRKHSVGGVEEAP